MTKIVSFNVNSVNARLENVKNWLKISNPDIILLQELKCMEEKFPKEEFLDLGYDCAIYGQKSYNGVAILSKYKIEDVTKGLLAFSDDQQARYIEAVIIINQHAIRVASIYVPNGGGELQNNEKLEDSAKFKYKIDFFDKLKNHLSNLLKYNEIQIFGGDFNVAIDEIDCYDAQKFRGNILFHDLERKKMREIINLGLCDSFRSFNNDQQLFSWWDYRGNAWQYNKGCRIDYLLTSPKASDLIKDSFIEDKGVRDQVKASDHCPVCLTLDLN